MLSTKLQRNRVFEKNVYLCRTLDFYVKNFLLLNDTKHCYQQSWLLEIVVQIMLLNRTVVHRL